jgi:hypothetical protein
MALVLGNKESRKVELEASEPLEGGKLKNHRFAVEFKLLPKADWDNLFKSDNASILMIDAAMDSIKNIDGIVDENGSAVEYDDNVKLAILNERWLHESIIDGFMAVNLGKTLSAYRSAKLKNS